MSLNYGRTREHLKETCRHKDNVQAAHRKGPRVGSANHYTAAVVMPAMKTQNVFIRILWATLGNGGEEELPLNRLQAEHRL